MFEILFKNLLLANYSFAKRWVNKKNPERIIPATLHIFTTPFSFIMAGIYCWILGSLDFKFTSFLPTFIGLGIIMLPFQFFLEKKIKKAIHQWQIEKEYKSLSKNERWNKNTLAFLFFWIGFGVFLCLGAKFMEGYLIE
ncbi:hypothetical protein JJL45_12765 [Tamlana sp. s12]|uniref:hypothetical protein n=1 Tax=Tamlana sp. s12 TaxID=1630406 RepID=UPI00080152AF|nr:hypothetical protein [Tamlana sp. s12]OBQ56577.1 hypothetical protein VQ01_04330 [Tamlana sp. s12]QQY81786.1 hypothetical protein JJL45_12765 [Tamlana sp. s12]